MMRVLFVYPDWYSVFPRHFNVGIASLMAVTRRAGHEIRFVYAREQECCAGVLQCVRDFQPEVVAYSVVSAMVRAVEQMAPLVKAARPQAFQVAGGIHPTLQPEMLATVPALDAICRGEGEAAFLELLQRLEQGRSLAGLANFWWRNGATIERNPLRPLLTALDELPYPERELFDYDRLCARRNLTPDGTSGERTAEFLFMRGCPYDCSYCCNRPLRDLYPGQCYVRWPSPEWAIGQVRETVNRYRIELVLFHDDCFTLNRKWCEAFLDLYQAGVALPFWVNARVGTFDEALARRLKAAGCSRIIIGIESGSPRIRQHVLNRTMTNGEIVAAFRTAASAGLVVSSQNMIGLPFETPADIAATIRLNAELYPIKAGVYIFHPYPGTALHALCHARGWVRPGFARAPERSDTVLAMPQVRRRHILFYYRHFRQLIERMHRARSEQSAFWERVLPITPPWLGLVWLHEQWRRGKGFLLRCIGNGPATFIRRR